MAKKFLGFNQMSSVDTAADYAARLLHGEAKGPGDTANAMHRIEAKYGVPYWTQWSLRYKRPKQIAADAFYRIQSAYWSACEMQAKRALHEVEVARAVGGNADDDLTDLVAQAEDILAKIKAKQAMLK